MSLVEFRFLAETGHSQTELQISAVDPKANFSHFQISLSLRLYRNKQAKQLLLKAITAAQKSVRVFFQRTQTS